MSKINFIDENGSFEINNPQHTSGLYLPLASNKGLKSAVTPDFGGDAKTDQNHFLLAPKSIMNLSSDRDTRNFFLIMDGGLWSATGVSAMQEANRFTEAEDEVKLTAGRMWQTVTRLNKAKGLAATTTIFDLTGENAEIMVVTLENKSETPINFEAVAAIPVFGRSADNLRDHRHVTSLLNRAAIVEDGVLMQPTLSFDERGHKINDSTYYVFGRDENGNAPTEFMADADDYLGDGGTFLRPRSLLDGKGKKDKWMHSGDKVNGKECLAALRFEKVTLNPGEKKTYQIAIGMASTDNLGEIDKVRAYIKSVNTIMEKLSETKTYWINKTPIHFNTGNPAFDGFMEWVAFQPELRRIFGCSFLPHHDYGRGGRGWRDLWQDCLALLLTDPTGVRQMLLDNFKGVRMDGSNATIIGDKPGEFKGDRNGIPRVWMDHGFWPFLTVKLYMDQTGDLDLFKEEVTYFRDALMHRGGKLDEAMAQSSDLIQKTVTGAVYKGTVLEHLLIEGLTAFYDVGVHGHIKLRNADWNDALDMAAENGESVAFTCGYAGNLKELATYLRIFMAKSKEREMLIAKELLLLLEEDSVGAFANPKEKLHILDSYMDSIENGLSGERVNVSIEKIALLLEHKSEFLMKQIRSHEWVTDGEGNGWYNGYYDNNKNKVEGVIDGNVRMMLTGQVFAIMSGTAKRDAVDSIISAVDKYLYKKDIGGYTLNTDFGELKTDLGRMFGFSYGDKENGAVFSHMAVMYAAALYKRGYAKEGFKALNTLFETAADFDKSHIYPGIPEYFNADGRGLYSYLTGAASWYLMTMIIEAFGVRGSAGDLNIEPKLMKEQFDENGIATISLNFRGHSFTVIYKNPKKKSYKEYEIGQVIVDNTCIIKGQKNMVSIPENQLDSWNEKTHVIEVELK
ncbi:Glycosyltransferase family 36 [Pseudobutyrivibrio sp. OR37]|uniref:GH36-type glycosyl hydrolase domain-containing protein n=1 Tax=Pseudobutyrivibrio sp. OR37 TaxID=1798186 RepID=UPI0008E0DC6B|nr:cellobiose phosphorylase [Pseudobutyrivibrio sp. OR37]SFH69357.1 Glycosyltransferase family 36 [Pseudobutyrivibrio sp. OR37]